MASDIWAGKAEPQDFVTCRVCAFKATTLATHLPRKHGLSADTYRAQHPGASIRCVALTEKRQGAAKKGHVEKPRAGLKKIIECPSCGDPREVGFTFAPSTHDARCAECRAKDEDAFWAAKQEGVDYVTCHGCGHRAENLTSHVQNAHREWVGCYPGQMVADNSAVRDKTALKGRVVSEEVRAKMSTNAGRWNAGLTKETDVRVAQMAETMRGREAWSSGLTKDTDDRLQQTALTVSKTRSIRHWTSNEVSLTKEQLLPFALKNGKISVGRAIAALGHAFVTIRRECARHGLSISNTAVLQAICLETISQVLGGASYEMEWNDARFTNPKTGRRFRFDGFFPKFNLLVEFHGRQHWEFPSTFIEDKDQFLEQQERDRLKKDLIDGDPELRLLVVREDEPYADPVYLRERLINEGFPS